MHSEPFGCLTKLDAKQTEQVQKFVPRSRVGIFRNERTRSTPLDPKMMFWCVLYHLGTFETIWLPYESRCETGRTSPKVRPTKSRRNFSQQKHPIHPIGPIWVHSGPFDCLKKLGAKRAELVQKFVPRHRKGIFRNESPRTTPLDPKMTLWCILYYLGAFGTV